MLTPLRVLIVEDSADDAELMLLRLKAEGFQTDSTLAQTQTEFLTALQGAPDLILADWSLPQFSGLRALQLMRERGLDIPFIIVSGSIGEEAAVDALRQGACDYVLKDRPARLGMAVRRSLEDNQLRQERKRAEQALKKAAADWEVTFDTTTDGIYLLDSDHRIIRINRALERMLNVRKEDTVGQLCWQVLHGSNQPIPACPLVRAKESKRRESLEYKAGERYFEFIVDPILDDSGVLTGAVHILRDITERKQTEQKIAAMLRFQNEMLDTPAIWIDTLDAAGNITFWNRGAERISGYKREEVMGHGRVWEWLYPDADERDRAFAKAMAIIQQGERVDNFETTIRAKDGQTRIIAWYSNNLVDENGRIAGSIALGADVTWHKQIEESLRESNAFSESLLQTIPFGMDIVDEEGTVLYLNPVLETALGRQPIGQACWQLYRDDKRQCADCPLQHPIQVGKTKTLESVGVLGSRTFEISHTGMIYRGKKAILEVFHDITERKQAEAALQESEARYRRLAENARDIIFRYSILPEMRLTYINPVVQEITGYTPEECYADPLLMLNLAYPDDAPTMGSFVSARTPPEKPLFMRWVGKDGVVRWMESRMTPVFNEAGQIVAVEGITRDMTERKQTEEELHRAHEMLRMVLDTIPQRVFWKGRDLTYLGANTAFAQDAGVLDPAAIIGKRDTDLIWSAHSERFQSEDRQIIATDTPLLGLEESLTLPDGAPRWQRISKAPLHDGNGAVIGVLGIYEDISEQKRADEKLRQTLEELANTNAELERFAYVASHDLQEPLRMVASFVQLLAERYRGQLDSDADEFIGFAVDGAQRMQQLINDLLAYSRIGTRSQLPQPTDAEAVLNDALWNLSFAIEEAGAVVTHAPLPAVLADRTQLLQLFQNLIGNALKFHGSEPPRVHVTARAKDDVRSMMDDGRLPDDEAASPIAHQTSHIALRTSHFAHPTSEWVFSVRDNGIGIAPEYHERIFGVFQRLHSRSEYPGTGIGLAICKRVVERHGGRIWIESQVGQGTTFYFTLPAVPDAAPLGV
jgi:PAS domain S-box-containing protein